MKTVRRVAGILAAVVMMGACGCGPDDPPSRDHIPALRGVLQRLGNGVRERNRAAIDSLLSVQILDVGQSSDSLLHLVYGPDPDFAFHGFALGEITYRNDRARVDCFIADTSMSQDRPLVITLVFEHDMWLVKQFSLGKARGEDHPTNDTVEEQSGRQ